MVLNNNFISETKTNVKTVISDNMTHIDFGTGTTTPTIADSAMEASIIRLPRQDITTLSSSVIVSGFLGSGQGNGSTVTEIGVFDGTTATGIMMDHALISGIVKTSSKEIWVDIRTNITVSQTINDL